MTNQKAGRGEGLAGLVAKLRDIGDRLRTTNVARGREIHQICDDFTRALEAAAPPGTAPVTTRILKDAVIYSREKGCPFSDEWFETVVRAINALATPLPQAPRTVLQQHQDKAISILRPYVCGSEFGECVALVAQAIADASPAATQEPAGSGARENDLWLELARILRFEKGDDGDWFIPAEPQPLGPFFSILQAVTAFMRHIDATDKTMREEIEQLRGSPRKVGEDGASELKVGDSVRVSGIVESISTDGTLIKVDFGMGEYCYPNRLLLHPRSSSVPVGEQK